MPVIDIFGKERLTSAEEADRIICHQSFTKFVDMVLHNPELRRELFLYEYDADIEWIPNSSGGKLYIDEMNILHMGRPFPYSISRRLEEYIDMKFKEKRESDEKDA